jgi:hypothetical protein
MQSSVEDDPLISRCPACGQRLENENAARCPLCNFEFAFDTGATGDDVTPFAQAYAREESGRRRMCEWVWFAGVGRLKHLALMRVSAAARSFARLHFLLFAAGLALIQATHHGWQAVTASAALEPTGAVRPLGQGWLHVAATPHPYRLTQPPSAPIDLWWNPPQAVIAGACGFLAALLLLWLAHVLTRAGVVLAHHARYRRGQRLSAALLYSTAWGLPLLFSAILFALRPLGRIGAIERWSWYPSEYGFELAAGMIAAFDIAFWWFWLVRLGATAPADTRGRVCAFFAVGAPLITTAASAAWWFGLDAALHALFTSWKLHF